ncbi:helix-turn-helix domain-containing protein [Marinactinospora thermotolerans]|uniref:HTH cro/C1-type domain-containing protein n=1 Tax=Marinactinospora thermotolerans DSM 45154 TaxID=1122192 RepID=A0A1T4T406_9ACTN|nr:helix-turn-helix transcriptional regulator [Marinactinospora thermotolerans]SKA34878.1 hypothetical protein SAMN02745673_04413 [Marinactinospora thermotolerans DSM 45154]
MTSPIIRRHHLSLELRRRRELAGLSHGQAAAALGWPALRIERIETGVGEPPTVVEVAALLRLYEVDAGQRDALLSMVHDSRSRPWWTDYEDVVSSAYVGNESGAVRISTYAGLLVPDLLQVPGYTALLARSQGHDERGVERTVAAFLKRQEILRRAGLERYHALVEEDALRRLEGEPEVLRAQLSRLIEAAEWGGRTRLQLLPTSVGPHAGAAGPFTILEFDEDEGALAFVEATHGGAIVEERTSVGRCAEVWERLTGAALGLSATLVTLKRLALLF